MSELPAVQAEAIRSFLASGTIPPHKASAIADKAADALKRKDPRLYVIMRLGERRQPNGRRVLRYEPHDASGSGGQVAFHSLAVREKYAIAGIRSGKSIGGANELCDQMALRPSTFDDPSRWAVMTPTYRDAERILEFTLFRYLPPDTIARANKSDYEYTLVDGTKLYIISTEHVDRIDTLPDLDGCWADEVEDMPAIARLKMIGRLGNRRGNFWGTTTPQKWSPTGVKRLSWLFALLQERGITILPGDSGIKTAKDISIVTWGTEQNPHFPEDEIALMEEKFGPALAAQELHAGYIDLEAGQTYRAEWFVEFDPPKAEDLIHVVVTHDPAISIKGGADFSCSHVLGEDRAGNFWLLEEWRDHFTFPQQVDLLWNLPVRLPAIGEIAIEQVAYQEALIQELREKFRTEKHPNPVRITPLSPDKGNADRLAGTLATGRVRFARGIVTREFLNEFLAYPRWPHDDRITALGYGIALLRRSAGGRPAAKVRRSRRRECAEIPSIAAMTAPPEAEGRGRSSTDSKTRSARLRKKRRRDRDMERFPR